MVYIDNGNKICFSDNDIVECSDAKCQIMIKGAFSDLQVIKSMGLIAISKELYEKCEGNKIKLLVLLSMISLKEQGICKMDNRTILHRVNFIKKYFDIDLPKVGKTGVYFKPDMKVVEDILIKIKNSDLI